MIISAANTVSRASDAVSGPPTTIRVTINDTSMMVTATARTSEPNGSPTRWATTSAWCTAASTEPASSATTTTSTTAGGSCPQLRATATRYPDSIARRGRAVAVTAQGDRRDRQHRHHDLP